MGRWFFGVICLAAFSCSTDLIDEQSQTSGLSSPVLKNYSFSCKSLRDISLQVEGLQLQTIWKNQLLLGDYERGFEILDLDTLKKRKSRIPSSYSQGLTGGRVQVHSDGTFVLNVSVGPARAPESLLALKTPGADGAHGTDDDRIIEVDRAPLSRPGFRIGWRTDPAVSETRLSWRNPFGSYWPKERTFHTCSWANLKAGGCQNKLSYKVKDPFYSLQWLDAPLVFDTSGGVRAFFGVDTGPKRHIRMTDFQNVEKVLFEGGSEIQGSQYKSLGSSTSAFLLGPVATSPDQNWVAMVKNVSGRTGWGSQPPQWLEISKNLPKKEGMTSGFTTRRIEVSPASLKAGSDDTGAYLVGTKKTPVIPTDRPQFNTYGFLTVARAEDGRLMEEINLVSLLADASNEEAPHQSRHLLVYENQFIFQVEINSKIRTIQGECLAQPQS